MATHGNLVGWLMDGSRDTSGNYIASGKAYFYDPGTTNEQTVYDDAALTSAITQPLTLNAYGGGEVWTKSAVRIVIKDSTEVTTHYDVDYATNVRAEQVYITHPDVNGNTEITLNDFFTDTGGALGMYNESSTATARAAKTWLQESKVLVTDYNAQGDGSTDDDDEIQATLDRVAAADRTNSSNAKTVIMEIPQGTWNIDSAITQAVASGTEQIIIRGHGPNATIIEQQSTSADGLHLNYTNDTDVRTLIEDLSIRAATTSSGTALKLTKADKVTMRRVATAGFRVGIDTSAADESKLYDCEILSTDGNAAAVGIDLGDNAVARDCWVTGTSDAGDGIQISGTDVVVDNCHTSGNNLEIDCNAKRARIRDCHATVGSSKNGIDIGGAHCRVNGNYVIGSSSTNGILTGTSSHTSIVDNHIDGFTTGINIGAGNGNRVVNNNYGTNTADLSVDSAVTVFHQSGNTDGDNQFLGRAADGNDTDLTLPASVTPVITGNVIAVNTYNANSNTGALTINNTATTNLMGGEILMIVIYDTNGSASSIVWDTQYEDDDNGGDPPTSAITNFRSHTFCWIKDRSKWQLIDYASY